MTPLPHALKERLESEYAKWRQTSEPGNTYPENPYSGYMRHCLPAEFHVRAMAQALWSLLCEAAAPKRATFYYGPGEHSVYELEALVAEREEEIYQLHIHTQASIQALEARNAKLTTALKDYAKLTYDDGSDAGEIAREALKNE